MCKIYDIFNFLSLVKCFIVVEEGFLIMFFWVLIFFMLVVVDEDL